MRIQSRIANPDKSYNLADPYLQILSEECLSRNACLFSVMCQNLVKRTNRKTVCYKDTVRARDPTPDNVSSSASSPLLIGQSLSGPGVLPTNQSPRKARQKQRARPTKETQDCDGRSSCPALQTIFHLLFRKKDLAKPHV
jgi:hypothetical protein